MEFKLKKKTFKLPQVTFPGITVSVYRTPCCSAQGPIVAWWGKHSAWKHGFVIRVLWFGFVLRWDT